MLKEFFRNDVETTFIKSLVYNTPIPIYDTVQEGDLILEDCCYIFGTHIIQCTKSGYLLNTDSSDFNLKLQDIVLDTSEEFVTEELRGTLQGYPEPVTVSSDTATIVGEYEEVTTATTDKDNNMFVIITSLHSGFYNSEVVYRSLFMEHLIDISRQYNFYFYYTGSEWYEWDNDLQKATGDSLGIDLSSYGIYYEGTPNFGDILQVVYTPQPDDDKRVKADWMVIDSYQFGDDIKNITRKYIPKSSYYDSRLHRYLGDYLRCVRDIYHIDLMHLYNCFSYELLEDIYLTHDINKPYVLSSNSSVKILSIPIKFNKTYTIYIDGVHDVLAYPVLRNASGLIKSGKRYIADMYNGFKDDLKLVSYQSISFKQPVTYTLNTKNVDLYRCEKFLRLLIQIPSSNESSIVILEGNHQNTAFNVVDSSKVHLISDTDMNLICSTTSSLCLINDNKSYAYSSKLIEYLLRNVITNREDIDNNLDRIQKILSKIHKFKFEDDFWTNDIRYQAYKHYMQSSDKYSKLDITGFIDSDVEKFLYDKVAR